ncbi:MAG TPA: transglutaminase-like domain-containing protein [Tissierellales bacterium]|nr:transglutaminase-like domain-containing protein [Tissierellales bacterium]
MENLYSLTVDLPEDVKRLTTFGDYDKALELIEIYMERNIPKILKDRLNFEKDRMRRFKQDYIYSYEDALKLAKNKIKDFTKEELENMKNERFADWAYINGQVYFHKKFLDNIIQVNTELDNRIIDNVKTNKAGDVLDKTIDEITHNGDKKYYFRLKTGIKIKKEHAKIGEIIKVHIPIPRAAQQIKNIKILKTSHEPKIIAPESHLQRTIYFEERLTGDDEFTVEYSYENHVKYRELDRTIVSTDQPHFCTGEWPPHIVFSPFLVSLAEEIVGDEINPLIKARNIYNYITQNIQYSYVRQYAAIINAPEYAAYNLKGDCGIQAMLFITLCRIVGIPARWQSGLYSNPHSIGCHDWAEFYIEPYGWLFADPSFGGGGYRRKDGQRWNFYFGNLDPFRMVANSEFHYDFYPAKKYLRSDPYDNQIGEAEYLDRPIFDDEFDTIMEIVDTKEIK